MVIEDLFCAIAVVFKCMTMKLFSVFLSGFDNSQMHQKAEVGRGPSKNDHNVAKVVECSSKEDFS